MRTCGRLMVTINAFRRNLELRNSDVVLDVESGAISGEAQQRVDVSSKAKGSGLGLRL